MDWNDGLTIVLTVVAVLQFLHVRRTVADEVRRKAVARHAEGLRYLHSRQQLITAMEQVHSTKRREILNRLDGLLDTGEAEQLRSLIHSDCGLIVGDAFDGALFALCDARDAVYEYAMEPRSGYPVDAVGFLAGAVRLYDDTKPRSWKVLESVVVLLKKSRVSPMDMYNAEQPRKE